MSSQPNQSFMYQLMTEHIWMFTVWIIPISVCYDILWWVRTRWIYWISRKDSHLRHYEKVKDVQRQVEEWNKSGCKQPMCTARPGWQSITFQQQLYKKKMFNVKIDMGGILKIDTENKFVRVEPMVTIGNLNDFLIGQGWTLPIVPELDDLTIGGLVMGGGIESTSHKYGLFQSICQAYELVLGDASSVWCSPTENPDLFVAQPFCYGTLGFLTCVDIDIIPYKPYMKLTYHSVNSLDAAVDKFAEVTNDPEVDSVEGIIYTMDSGVIMSGKFVDRVPPQAKYNPINRWYKPWFYTHVEKYMDDEFQKTGNVEYIPTNDFYHRHNRAYFWLLKIVLPFANNVVFRWLFGWSMPVKFALVKRMRQKLLPEEVNVNFVLQDYIIGLKHLKEALRLCHDKMEIYPIWLCPLRHINREGITEDLITFAPKDVRVDVGIYGFSPIKGFDPETTQKCMESYTTECNGFAALYAETKLTYEEYSKMFACFLRVYDSVRRKYNCEKAFPHVYHKISSQGRTMT